MIWNERSALESVNWIYLYGFVRFTKTNEFPWLNDVVVHKNARGIEDQLFNIQ